MNTQIIRDRLVARGQELLDDPSQLQKVKFTNNSEADKLLKDLNNRPHAFVLACLMDRQMPAEKAWLIPYAISQRSPKLVDFSITELEKLTLPEITELMFAPKPLHRFVEIMSVVLHSAIRRINSLYNGDASRIWTGRPSSAEVVYRFLEFDGVGPKIATMATNILARDFKIEFSDHVSIDISADVHIRRVFFRLGLCPRDASVEQIIYKTRALYPKFPGIMDLPCWEIGKNWCKAQESSLDCQKCYMNALCPTAKANL